MDLAPAPVSFPPLTGIPSESQCPELVIEEFYAAIVESAAPSELDICPHAVGTFPDLLQ